MNEEILQQIYLLRSNSNLTAEAKIRSFLEFCKLPYSENVPLSCENYHFNDVDIKHFQLLLNRLFENQADALLAFNQMPYIGYKDGSSVIIFDGRHRIMAIKDYNKVHEDSPIKIKLSFLIEFSLEPYQISTLISLADEKVRDCKRTMTKVEIMRHAWVILKCPQILGLKSLPTNAHTKYEDERKCAGAIIDFFHVYPSSLVLRNIWKVSRFSVKDAKEIFDLFEKLPCGFSINDYDVLFKKYSHSSTQIMDLLKSLKTKTLTLLEFRSELKRIKREFIPLLKDYGIFDGKKNEAEHVSFIADKKKEDLFATKREKEILVNYVVYKLKNINRYESTREKLNYLKKGFKDWFEKSVESRRESEEISSNDEEFQLSDPTYKNSNRTNRKRRREQVSQDFHDFEWFKEFIEPQINNGFKAAAAFMVHAEIERLKPKETLLECFNFYQKYLKEDKTYDCEKLLLEQKRIMNELMNARNYIRDTIMSHASAHAQTTSSSVDATNDRAMRQTSDHPIQNRQVSSQLAVNPDPTKSQNYSQVPALSQPNFTPSIPTSSTNSMPFDPRTLPAGIQYNTYNQQRLPPRQIIPGNNVNHSQNQMHNPRTGFMVPPPNQSHRPTPPN